MTIIFLFLLSGISTAQESIQASGFSDFVNRVNGAPEADRTAIVDSFMSAVPGFPYIEGPFAYFIYRGSATSITVSGDANMWDPYNAPMTKLSTTDFWYRSQYFESDARIDYKFILNGSNWILDPRNPHTVSGGYGPNSELAMPLYVQPWEIVYKPGIQHGRTESKTIYSTYRSTNYNVTIYLPPGYDAGIETYPTVYFQDGSDYINLGSATRIIDNLLDSLKIRPMIAVFVTPTNRNEEYAGSTRTQYRQFFVYELVPYIDTNYRTIPSPNERAVLGDSYGGNISALISYYHPDLFGNCGLHSGAFQTNGYEAFNLIVNGTIKKDSIRYCSVWGTYEGSLTQNMRAFRDSLKNLGYDIKWKELHEGHSWGQWRATTDVMLEYFFPYITGIKEIGELPASIKLFQNYPNPFNPTTKISFVISRLSIVTLKIFNLLGKEEAILVNDIKQPGEYSVNWDAAGTPSGVYFYRLQAGDIIKTRKLLLVR
jgi:enterochelin esterase family protein